jgi:hypothetical protein
MAKAISTFLDRLIARRELHRWTAEARNAATAPLPALRQSRTRARTLKARLDDLIHTADGRLALPLIGSNIFPVPHGTDWAWRPDIWRGPLPLRGIAAAETQSRLGDQVTLHHDCKQSELTILQTRNNREEDLAPFGLRMDVLAFGGSFLSLAIELPPDAIRNLTKSHLIRLSAQIEVERPLEVFARLNVVHGPNTEQVTRELSLKSPEVMIEFDLAYSGLNEKRLEKAWVDLIFENPEMNQVVIRDLTFARCPRAEF